MYPSPASLQTEVSVLKGEAGAGAGMETEVADPEIERLYGVVQTFSLASHMFWGLWAVIQSKFSKNDFDYLMYGAGRFEALFWMKSNAADQQGSQEEKKKN